MTVTRKRIASAILILPGEIQRQAAEDRVQAWGQTMPTSRVVQSNAAMRRSPHCRAAAGKSPRDDASKATQNLDAPGLETSISAKRQIARSRRTQDCRIGDLRRRRRRCVLQSSEHHDEARKPTAPSMSASIRKPELSTRVTMHVTVSPRRSRRSKRTTTFPIGGKSGVAIGRIGRCTKATCAIHEPPERRPACAWQQPGSYCGGLLSPDSWANSRLIR